MALLAPFFALVGRFVGRILTTTLGWASTLLFGRVPQDRQVWLAALTFGSLAWVAAAVGVVVPAAGAFLLTALPLPDWLDDGLVRLAMLIVALILPAVLGAVSLLVSDPEDRPHGRAILGTVVRGYALAPALAITLVILAGAGTTRKIDALAHRRRDAHVAIVVRPGRYEALVDVLLDTLDDAGLVTERRPGARVLTIPAKLLAGIAGRGMSHLVPDELAELHGPHLTIAVYPSDLAMAGSLDAVARARALITRDVRSRDAWFTTSREAQAVEDRLAAIERSGMNAGYLAVIDATLLKLTIPQDEWEVLYRRRLQLTSGPTDLPDQPGGHPVASAVGDAAGPDAAGPDASRARPDVDNLVGIATAVLVLVDLVTLVIGRARESAGRARR